MIDESKNPSDSQIESTNNIQNKESRYPSKDELLEIMSLGEPEFLGNIDTIYPDDIAEHQNKVEVINANARELMELKYHGKSVKCVFKPFAGENVEVKENDVKKHNGKIDKFYPREAFAFTLSEHFNLDIVPPTVVRDFGEGRMGALQLFIPTDQYLSSRKLSEKYPDIDDEGWDKLIKTDDFAKMVAFDFIIANCDRNSGNYLVRIKRENGVVECGVSDDPKRQSLIAIDHGMCMDSDLYSSVEGEKDGPIITVTNGSKEVKIPEELMALLKLGLDDKDDFNAELIDNEITEQEVANMWMRVEALCQKGIYLSKYNIKKYPELITNGGVLANHPQIFISGY